MVSASCREGGTSNFDSNCESSGCHTPPSRAGMVAQALTSNAADSGDLLGGASGRKHRRRFFAIDGGAVSRTLGRETLGPAVEKRCVCGETCNESRGIQEAP